MTNAKLTKKTHYRPTPTFISLVVD